MSTTRALTIVGASVLAAGCARAPRPAHDASSLTPPTGALAMTQTSRSFDLDLTALAGQPFVPGAWAAVGDGIALELPAAFPGRWLHVDGRGAPTAVVGRLLADAALSFVREGDALVIRDPAGAAVYRAHERVTSPAPWTATAPASGCCAWWEHTLWRTAALAPTAGILRVVTPELRSWSVIDWHRPGDEAPVWRAVLTGGEAAVAAAVAPRGDVAAVVIADGAGHARLQTYATADGTAGWSAPLATAAAEWRRSDGRLAISFDGARLAVLVEDPARGEAYSAIEVYDAAGVRRERIGIDAVVAPRSSQIGVDGDRAWLFERVTEATTELSTRPARTQFESHALAGGRAAAPVLAADVWGVHDRVGRPGIVAIARTATGVALTTYGPP